jgi:hypothetical protein
MSGTRDQLGNDNFSYLTIPDQGGPGSGFVEYIPVDDFFDKVSTSFALCVPHPPPHPYWSARRGASPDPHVGYAARRRACHDAPSAAQYLENLEFTLEGGPAAGMHKGARKDAEAKPGADCEAPNHATPRPPTPLKRLAPGITMVTPVVDIESTTAAWRRP